MESTVFEQQNQHHRVRHFFDSSDSWKGKLYSDHQDRFNKAMVRRKQYAFEMLHNVKDLTIGRSLDIGCGCGIYSKELETIGFETFGIDVSSEMIRQCRDTLSIPESEFPRRFMVAEAEHLPFDEKSFDLILSVGLFGYLVDDCDAIREIYRVLKPGGYLFLSVQNIVSFSNVDYAVRAVIRNLIQGIDMRETVALPVPWVTSHSSTGMFYKSYFPGKLRQMLCRHGFTIVNEMTLGYELRFARRTGLFPDALLVSTEERLERLAHSVPVFPLKYSGDTYSVLFRKNLTQG